MRMIALKIQVLEHSLSSSAKAHNPVYEIQSQYFIYPDEKFSRIDPHYTKPIIRTQQLTKSSTKTKHLREINV